MVLFLNLSYSIWNIFQIKKKKTIILFFWVI